MNDVDLRGYLLGQTTEAEAERVEIRALEDEDFFVTLRGVEDDLFDEYVRDTITEAERPLFLARYGDERGRLLVAHALSERTARARAARPHMRVRYWTLAAAAVLAIGVGVTLTRRSAPSRERVAAGNVAPAVVAQASDAVAPPSTTPPVALLLTLGTARSESTVPDVALPSSAAVLQLRVRLDPADTFDTYAMELRSSENIVIWRGDLLRAESTDGNRTIAGSVPAASLIAAPYELTVLGTIAGREAEVLGFAALRVTR